MSSIYIGVYKALYEYAAQADEELDLKPDDILYLLEKSDVDDWWKVKKRVLPVGDEEVDEPVGLVPSNYIEEAPAIKFATALYDYTKQTEEELSFTEGEKFKVFDLNDPDWLLVGDVATNTQFGFVPANYINLESQAQTSQPQANYNSSYLPDPRVLAPPPLHPSQAQQNNEPATKVAPLEPEEPESPYQPRKTEREVLVDNEEEEEAPPMPSRPSAEPTPQRNASRNTEPLSPLEDRRPEQDPNNREHTFDGEFFTWYIDEVEGRKKRPVVLSIGQGLIILKPNTTNPKRLKLKSASSLDNQWRVRDLKMFSNEKKHVFLEFRNPEGSIELHAGTKDTADAIISILADLKGAESAKGLKEVAMASKTSTDGKNRKIGRLMYDFDSQDDDELMCREGDEVYIINESKSKEWWMCENTTTGKQGVVPSSYIEIIGTSNLEKLTETPSRSKSRLSSKGRVVDSNKGRNDKYYRSRSRDERDRIREKDRIQRDKHESKRDSNDKSMPNYHRVRTWIDSSGSFKVEAEFLGCIDGKIHLHKTNGVKIAVGATKLSLEDLDYVEKVTGTSLESYKKEVSKQTLKRSRSKSSGVSNNRSATAAINDVPPQQPDRPRTSSNPAKEPDYDWFEFFLECGVDIGNCQRYSVNFSREQMDENILEDISPSLLRTLGLREGDILRVMKFLDAKFNRTKTSEEPSNASRGGLFTEATGALKANNSSQDVSRVSADALPSPSPQPPNNNNSNFEDDAWAVKPAARSSEDLLKPQQQAQSQPQTPQYTGALQDLVNIKPLEYNHTKSPANINKPMPSLPSSSAPSAPALTPTKTGPTIQKTTTQNVGGLIQGQKTGLTAANTGGLIPVQTGGLIPVQTGGLMVAQPTGFVPITAQPTGFVSIQPTGAQSTGIQPQFTFNIVPLQTGTTTFPAQRTGGQQQTGGIMPQSTFGQAPYQPALQTGGITMPQTSFGQPMQQSQPLSLHQTGPLVPAQRTGGFVPQSTFGQQITGGFNQPQTSFSQQPTGGFGQPPTSFSHQPTGGFNQPPTSFNQQPTGGIGQPFTSFSQQPTGGAVQPPNTFGQQMTGGFPQQNTFSPPPNTFGQQAGAFGQPQNTFGQFQPQQPTGQFSPASFGSPNPTSSFGQQPFAQQQTSFGTFQPNNQFGQNNNMNQMTNMFQNTSISQPQQPFPSTSFGQDIFQPLQSQPTGAGFGNAPPSLQAQQTGRRANLQAATPDNPFGF